MSAQQTDIFAKDAQQLHFAELCNALYERELQQLALSSGQNIDNLKRRLAGLSYHIKKAAYYLLNHTAPLEVDLHNASWQAKQATKSIAKKESAEKSRHWFSQYSHFGMPLAVCINEQGLEQYELDSVDRIDIDKQRLHLNKHGWFHFDGMADAKAESPNPIQQKQILLPSKASLTAACCGHSWSYRGKAQPRALSLRELLLSSKINWKNFKKPLI
ncbi:hypothetical protein [Neptunicella sp. SCSIO 80796]|uniref:hypothetical protein n=1 Tax=Neptunicella plasticusilytica TaxID=3117012 RepID=UPI003A4D37FE